MNDELIKKIVDGLKKSGHSQIAKLFEVTDEQGVEQVINELPEKPKSLIELLQQDKGMQSEFDKLVTKAVQTREEKIKKEFNLVKKSPDGGDDGNKGKSGKGMEKQSELEKEIEKLKELVATQFKQQEVEKKKSEMLQKLKEKKIPDRYIQFFDFENEEKPLEQQFEEITSEFENFKKEVINETVSVNGFPIPKGAGDKVSDDEIDEIVENL